MAIIILPVCFISIFLTLAILLRTAAGSKELLILSALSFSFAIAFITEILSMFHCLNYGLILIAWIIIAVANILFHYIRRDRLYRFYRDLASGIKPYLTGWSRVEWILIAPIFIILSLVFFQGITYPPTNWDSMTYHLARIVSWISQRSVAPFPTAITRQIYQPPFAEYVIMHFNMLSGNDYFSAAVQFFFLLFSLATIAAIVQAFGLSSKYQLGAVILSATIPEVVLQASSTQNDIVVSFFILAAFYCGLKAISTLKFTYYLFFGLTIGLGLLTKGTAYIYLGPVVIGFAIATIIRLFKTRRPVYLRYAMVIVSTAIIINSGYYYRNYNLTHNLLGISITEAQQYSNQKMSPALLLSNIIKNAGLHLGLMYTQSIAIVADSAIHKLHTAAAININDPATNFHGMKYGIGHDVNNEDSAPNLFHFLLISFAIVILLFNWKKWKLKPAVYSLLIIVIFQVIFFSFYLKWQPWNSRLHVPVFLMAIPLICYAFSLLNKLKKATLLIMPVLIIYALIAVKYNESRPISSKIFNENRYQKYFASKPQVYLEYDAVTKIINQNKFKNIGLMIGADDWEYPLFTNCYSTELNPIHISVNNITAKASGVSKNADCIISTNTNKPFIDYNNRRYYNQATNNNIIYLYR